MPGTAVLALLMFGAASAATSAHGDVRALATEVAVGSHAGIDAIVVSQHGEILATGRHPGLSADRIDIRSATKSITALLVGIAVDRGLIPSIDTKVSDLLPELADAFADPIRAPMTVRDLLTMRSGLDCDDWTPGSPGHEDLMYEQSDWLAFWANVPMREPPGRRFSYCTGNVVALGRILANTTGKSVPELAREALFEPLGVTGARWASWNAGRDTDTGGHLSVAPEGLLAIGQLVLAEGAWRGRQLVSRNWIRDMTRAHSDIPGRNQRYGYLWWLDETRSPTVPRTRLLLAWGNGGNFIVVMPELSAVYVSVGRRYNQPQGLEPLHWLRDRILPAMDSAARREATPIAVQF